MTTDPFAGLSADPAAAPAVESRSMGTIVTKGDVVLDPEATPYKLEFPVGFDGVEYREVRIHRLTLKDRANFVRSAGPRGLANVRQLVRTVDGKRIPAEVMDGMQWEDGSAIIDIVEPMIASCFPPPAKPPTFAGEGHSKTIFLGAPVEFGDKLYDRVTVRRLTARDFRTFFDADPEQRGRLPAFVDEAGEPIPGEVMDALDFDDNAAVMDAMELFIPAALKADRAPVPSSAPQPGEGSPRP